MLVKGPQLYGSILRSLTVFVQLTPLLERPIGSEQTAIKGIRDFWTTELMQWDYWKLQACICEGRSH